MIMLDKNEYTRGIQMSNQIIQIFHEDSTTLGCDNGFRFRPDVHFRVYMRILVFCSLTYIWHNALPTCKRTGNYREGSRIHSGAVVTLVVRVFWHLEIDLNWHWFTVIYPNIEYSLGLLIRGDSYYYIGRASEFQSPSAPYQMCFLVPVACFLPWRLALWG